MNINSKSSTNPYIQPQAPQTKEQSNVLEQEHGQGEFEDNIRDISNQAFHVNITDQARQALQTGRLQMETEPNQSAQGKFNSTETYDRENGQGPSRVIDLVA